MPNGLIINALLFFLSLFGNLVLIWFFLKFYNKSILLNEEKQTIFESTKAEITKLKEEILNQKQIKIKAQNSLEKNKITIELLQKEVKEMTQKNNSLLNQIKKDKEQFLITAEKENAEKASLAEDLLTANSLNKGLNSKILNQKNKIIFLEDELKSIQIEEKKLRENLKILENEKKAIEDENNLLKKVEKNKSTAEDKVFFISPDEVLYLLQKNSVNQTYDFLKDKYKLDFSRSKFTRDTKNFRNFLFKN